MWSRQDSIPLHAEINFDWVAKLESYHGATSTLYRSWAKLNIQNIYLLVILNTYLERVKVEDAVMLDHLATIYCVVSVVTGLTVTHILVALITICITAKCNNNAKCNNHPKCNKNQP